MTAKNPKIGRRTCWPLRLGAGTHIGGRSLTLKVAPVTLQFWFANSICRTEGALMALEGRVTGVPIMSMCVRASPVFYPTQSLIVLDFQDIPHPRGLLTRLCGKALSCRLNPPS
jgi:hypothetical protein